MNFATPHFIIGFLPAALILYHLSRKFAGGRVGLAVLVLLSFLFYAIWNASQLWVIVLSMAFNYAGARLLQIHRSFSYLCVLVAGNIFLLAYFKYQVFVASDLPMVFGGAAAFVLPLGISFFTFQQIAFLVEVYRGEDTVSAPMTYAGFVSFFPQLVAGPIVQHRELAQQLDAAASPSIGQSQIALVYLLLGLSKKLLIADPIGRWIDPAWAAPELMTAFDAWTAALGYMLQLYFDFSAYSDIAIGIALLFGINLPWNFDSPYKSRSISEFWRRWHMTLGTWLRDYVYIPAGGNRNGTLIAMFAIWATMLLGGLWHGVGLTFVLWASIHAACLTFEKLCRTRPFVLPDAARWALTVFIVFLAWIPFRAETIEDAFTVYSALIGFGEPGLPAVYAGMTGGPVSATSFFSGLEPVFMLICLLACLTQPNTHEIAKSFRLRWLHYPVAFAVSSACAFAIGTPSTFLYWSW